MQTYKAFIQELSPLGEWKEVVLHSDAQVEIAALNRAIADMNAVIDRKNEQIDTLRADLRIANGGIGTLDEMMKQREDHIEALTAERDMLREALEWVLPMAKGYAAEHPVGNNQQIVNQAQAALKIDK